MPTFQTRKNISAPRRPLVTIAEIADRLELPAVQLRTSLALASKLGLETPTPFIPRTGKTRHYDHMTFLRWWHAFNNRKQEETV